MKKLTILITLLLAIFLFGCHLSNERLSEKMISMYSENQNYITFFGEIIEFQKNDIVIKCEELNNYISYEDDFCDYYIYSNQIIELCIGEQIEFVTVPFHFYNGHKLPIVELKINGNTLLQFEEGKQNLIAWVNNNFK